jgi:hypothetical protein
VSDVPQCDIENNSDIGMNIYYKYMIRACTILVDNSYMETLRLDRDEYCQNTSLLHKAAFISYLCTPSEAASMFLLFTKLAEHLIRIFLHRDDRGNTFMHLLWNRIAKRGIMPSKWTTTLDNDEQRHKYPDRGE